jgi:hypothetical protein
MPGKQRPSIDEQVEVEIAAARRELAEQRELSER